MEKECDIGLDKIPFSLLKNLENLKGEDIENLLYYDLIEVDDEK